MTHDDHKELLQNMLERTVNILRDDPRVLAYGISGSGARNELDGFSDIDSACYLRDEKRSGLHEILDKVASQAPLLCRMWIYSKNGLFLFEDGTRLDLDIHPPSRLKPGYWMSQMRALYDPDNVMKEAINASNETMEAERPDPKDPVEWCFWMFRQIVCWAKRGNQGGHRSYDKLAAAFESLQHVRDYLVRVHLYTTGRHSVDPLLAERLSKTYPRFDASGIIDCAKLLLDEFETLCPEYCRQIGVDYPKNGVIAMHRLIKEYERLY